MAGATFNDTGQSLVARERRFSESKEGRIQERNMGREDVVRRFTEDFGGRQENKEEVKYREKEDRAKFRNVDETIKNLTGVNKPRRHSSRSRSKSGSLERDDGALMRRNRRDLGMPKKSEKDTDGEKHESIKGREHRSRNVRHKTSSSSDNSSLERDKTKNFERYRSRIVRRRSQNDRRWRSSSRDSRGRRGLSTDRSNTRDRSRSRSISLKRDRLRRRTSDSRRRRQSTSRDNGERCSTRRRSTSCSSDGRRSRDRVIRKRRSISRDNRERRSISKGRRRQRSRS